MKLDKIKFGVLIAWVSTKTRHMLELHDIEELDKLIDIDVEPVATQYVDAEKVNELLAALNTEGRIEAIKAYRSLTGLGLKESKECIDRYKNVKRND